MSEVPVSIIAIGSELLSGDVQDTNSTFLSRELRAMGLKVRRVCQVDDILEQIVGELNREAADARVIFTIGGLGPTSDDKTRDAVAKAASVALAESAESLERLEAHARRRGRVLNATNRRQAQFPLNAEIIENRFGTADGFITVLGSSYVISLPGPPKEFQPMVRESIMPWLAGHFSSAVAGPKRTLRCFGVSESHIGLTLETCGLPQGVEVAYRPQFPELLLTFSSAPGADGEALLEEALRKAVTAIGSEFVFSELAEDHLTDAVGKLLIEKNLRLAACESCSGGLLAHRLVSTPGASKFLLASVVAYSNSAKEVFAGVKPSLLEHYGAVSEETAIAMARGVRFRIGADIGVSITGIAGPDGGSEEKPAGTVWIGLCTEDLNAAYRYHLPYGRNAVRHYSVALALDLVRRKLLNYPLTWEMR